ncbi:uncharacterized protein LOC114860771 [Betta splendens]|uniref:Uncharacterized protein LOC114860771 n=1 Tax=Betta splendens TaxID=158456 RepID=A0A6P7NCB4_BETSP|nr:uncharacterized protein LOC114860771 [Betta splendens]
MRSRCLFLLVYVLGCCCGALNAQSNETCSSLDSCGPGPDPTSTFLQCVGLSSNATGRVHIHRLKGVLDATMDVYSFLRSSWRGVPVLLRGEVDINADPLQNEDLVLMWLEVNIKPLIKSISKHFLSCLSTRSFSCSTYQTVVRELSYHYSEMDPVRQKWTYTFFMYPFLSGDRVAGCVDPLQGSEEWLLRNLGEFRAEARVKDFWTLNVNFSGLDVLHLLSGAQKAELLLAPELVGFDNSSFAVVLSSLAAGGAGANWTGPGPDPHSAPQSGVRQVVDGFMAAFGPIRSLVHEFVSLAQTTNVSEIRSTTLTQLLLNWTLAELADRYRPAAPEAPAFDVTDVEDWYRQVVMPVLMRFLPNEAALMHHSIRVPFEEVFFLDNSNETSEIEDVCSITLDKNPCGVTSAVENLARVLSCGARSNLSLSETSTLRLLVTLTAHLNSLIAEFTGADFAEAARDLQQAFGRAPAPALSERHMDDPAFIRLWFRVKVMPLLPDVPPALLSCLSTKNFSCLVFQTIVAALSADASLTQADVELGRNVYEDFILPFMLRHRNSSDPQCFTAANQSAAWLMSNFGFFSRFASIFAFYSLNPNFSGLEVLDLLTSEQIAELILTSPEHNVIRQVFSFLVQSPQKFPEVLYFLIQLVPGLNPSCDVYRQTLESLYEATPALLPPVEALVWSYISVLISAAPVECVPLNVLCPTILYNATSICMEVDSADLQSYLDTHLTASCDFPLEKYACAQLKPFGADELAFLLECDLPGNSSRSKALWKMLLSEASDVLDPALDLLGQMPWTSLGPAAGEVLDVIMEIRLSLLSSEQLENSSVIGEWFRQRLGGFLPRASSGFLSCLSRLNLSCESYQQILQVFSFHFQDMTEAQQRAVLKEFILSFLSQPNSGPGCVNNSTNSFLWLTQNLGPFSMFLTVRDLLKLNPFFNPLQVLSLLTPAQTAELLVLNDPALPGPDVVINAVFDFLTLNSAEFPSFLLDLVSLLPQANLSCSSYKTLFTRLDLAIATVPLQVASLIASSKVNISQYVPAGCSIYGGQCNAVTANRTSVCAGVNSSTLQLYLDAGSIGGRLCDFTVEQFACAPMPALTAADLAALMKCNSSGSRPAWELLLSDASALLDGALDDLSRQVLDPKDPSVSVILDTIQEVRLGAVDLNDPLAVNLWFGVRLRPFLPAVSANFLSCLATQVAECPSYQIIVQDLSGVQPNMTLSRQVLVYTHFIKPFLRRNSSAEPSCLSVNASSVEWIRTNLGAFSVVVPFQDLQLLDPKFSALDALAALSPRQLAALSAEPGLLKSSAQVALVLSYVPNQLLPSFFDDFSSAIAGREGSLPSEVRTTLLQVVFDRVNLSNSLVSDATVSQWLQDRLRPLLVGLVPAQVAPFFQILAGRNCSLQQQGVQELNSVISTLGDETKANIYNSIFQLLQGPPPLRCYGNGPGSFYRFLELWFVGFQFPTLSGFLALIPPDRTSELLNTLSPSDVGSFLSRPGVIDDVPLLCVFYGLYNQTPVVLQTVFLLAAVKQETLPCVWTTALSRRTAPEVRVWFNSLQSYYVFLNRSLIGPAFTQNASCLAFKALVSVLDSFNYTHADFTEMDVYDSIRAYLTLPASVTEPRCYNPSDPDLNSTAWFAEYMRRFMKFLTLDDLSTFGSPEVIQVFTVNPLDLALLFQLTLPLNLTSYYTQLVYQEDSNFNPLLLPTEFECFAPGPAFTQLSPNESMLILHNLTTVCTNLDPQISAALASNLGNNIDAAALEALGNHSTSLSTGQIKTIRPIYLLQALSTLSTVQGWEESQAWAIVQALASSGLLQVNGSSSLLTLGSLVIGVPSAAFSRIDGLQLIQASTSAPFLMNLMSGPLVIQETFVTQIVAVNTNSEVIIQNVPDQMAAQIPRDLLLGFSNAPGVITGLNRKSWKSEQAALFFEVIGDAGATAVLGGPNSLSSSVLQGFTCTGVRNIQTAQIQSLVRACRRSGARRVQLQETQLTCMYNYIKGSPDVTDFTVYPPDVMLYYDYSLVPSTSCRSYFQQLGSADFFVFSSTLSYLLTNLFANSRSCLGITNTTLTKDNIQVLGSMCCTLDGSYIQNSNPYILEVLKSCPGLNPAQAAAAQSLLLSGSTPYGAPSTWNQQTLENLGALPLYLTSAFYKYFSAQTTKQFLRFYFTRNKVNLQTKQRLWQQINLSLRSRSRRSTADSCTVGAITQVTISDVTFPFDYSDINQFNACLSAAVVRDNLEAITQKVVQSDFLAIVLSRLQEAYGAAAPIPEDQVLVLGPASRVATVSSIGLWSITQIDTLSALMSPADGPWNLTLANAVISKYLSNPGNTLGSAELNAIGANLCALSADVLANISPQSLKQAGALNVSGCSAPQQAALFSVALQAFTPATRAAAPVSSFQLILPYLSGAQLSYVQGLVNANVSMDLATFSTLPAIVALNLTVTQVKQLLGANLAQLKAYENQTLVQSWIRLQPQVELDSLGLGLVGGTTATTAGPSSSTTTTTNAASELTTTGSSSTTTTTTATGTTTTGTTTTTTTTTTTGSNTGTSSTTASTTKGHCSRIQAHSGLSFLALLTLFILSQSFAL